MDSLTQLVTGAVLAAAVVPQKHRRAALAAGAALGTLPDLDVFALKLLSDDPIVHMTAHRSVSHTWLLLPWLSVFIWWCCRRQAHSRVREAPKRWLLAIALALLTHPLLDCFNAYGTWLFWPLNEQAVMWGNMFVIDPLFTLPLLLAMLWTLFKPLHARTKAVLNAAMAFSGLYLAWTFAAQAYVQDKVQAQLQEMDLALAPHLVTATPINSLLWQVLVMTPEGVLVGDYSLTQDDANEDIALTLFAHDAKAMSVAQNWPSVQRLQRFNQGFQVAKIEGDWLIISDVRMGSAPDYTFNFVVGHYQNGQWQPLEVPQQRQQRVDVAKQWQYLQLRIGGVN